ncbi:modulator protein [Rhodovulum sulfidophilum]|uniref:TldD/PmbA family protein n=1 Tax=Rhodovulum visakhapatnamense TaxID=364297 RepID=A0ABS1RBB3_9RHOB|nr:metallopeptidase TldD-related protein [Rhodovulum visakhapatnamense]MBL3570141.1 TldD/PmbA family protein [Rhodovulum visakhapatnamense]MBL3576938.1 TldD/PmbA family protein [Rhodovulum visakhapatnamense]OLS42986.1 modulator protein [Rhodovulum sulfidophilum]
MSDPIPSLTEALLDAARKAGAEAADALVTEGTSLSIDVRAGRLEQAERSEGIELGLRVLIGRRQACVSASDSRPETLAEMAARAVAMAREAPEDATVGLADPAQLAGRRDADALDLADPSPEPDPAALEDDARRAEAAARAVAGVAQVQSASAGYGHRRMVLAASNGFAGGYARTSRSVSCVAISGEGSGMERDWHSETRTFQAELPAPDEIGRIAGERAAALAGARRPRTGAYPVLFDERISASLIGHLLSAINGGAIVRGGSWARELLGREVLPPALSLIEDPHRPRIAGSRPFDAEGLPTARRALVENGVLTGWVLDLGSARKLGMESTGNAVRSVSAPPSPAAGNVTLTPGEAGREALISEMGTGLLVTSLIGSTINPTTGDYSRGASGFWVENGQIAYPVNECTIAGKLPEMLRRLRPANDARDHLSRRVPSLLVEGMTLAGA